MSKRRKRRYIGPVVLLVVAGLLGLGAALSTYGLEPVDAPIDLRAGATNTVEFRARHSDSYYVGVRMNGQQAQRLFPCMVNATARGCDPGEFPLEMLLHMQATGGGAPLDLNTNISRAGGSSDGNTFTRKIAYTWLEAGKTYRLTATSQVDGTALVPTTPRLVVKMEAISSKEKGLTAMLLTLLAWIAGAGAIVWAWLIGRILARRSAPSDTNS